MSATLEEIVVKISDRYDPDEVVEILNISTEELLSAFAQNLLDNLDKFDKGDEIDEYYEPEGDE